MVVLIIGDHVYSQFSAGPVWLREAVCVVGLGVGIAWAVRSGGVGPWSRNADGGQVVVVQCTDRP